MISRGVLYVVWGKETNPKIATALERSIASLRKIHPELAYHVHSLGDASTLLDKGSMYGLSPFDDTLFLDADTVVLDRLDYGFEQASRHQLACAICEAPYARRYMYAVQSDLIEYNTGVLFFRKSTKTRQLFERWQHHGKAADSRIPFLGPNGVLVEMPRNDQCGFALAVDETGFNPFVLPFNWNFRSPWHTTVFGPVKIWHGYAPVPPLVERFNKSMQPPAILNFIQV